MFVTNNILSDFGTQTLKDVHVRRHFADSCKYDADIELDVLETPKSKKGGRLYFPSIASDFVKESCQNLRKIYVLLFNIHLRSNLRLSADGYKVYFRTQLGNKQMAQIIKEILGETEEKTDTSSIG